MYVGLLFDVYFLDISMGFVRSMYGVDENSGLVQPVLGLDGPIECCSISVTVKVEDISAKGKHYV